MNEDDVMFFDGFVEAEDDIPEDEAIARNPASTQQEFELEDIDF